MTKSYLAKQLALKIDCTYLGTPSPFLIPNFEEALKAVKKYTFLSLCTYAPLHLPDVCKSLIVDTNTTVSYVINFPPYTIKEEAITDYSIEEEVNSIRELAGWIFELDVYLPENWSIKGKYNFLNKIAEILDEEEKPGTTKIIINVENCTQKELDESLKVIEDVHLPGTTLVKTSTGTSRICTLFKDLAKRTACHGSFNDFDGAYIHILGNCCEYILNTVSKSLKVSGNINHLWQVKYLIDRFGDKIKRFGISYGSAVNMLNEIEELSRMRRNSIEIDREFWEELLKKTEDFRDVEKLGYVTFEKFSQFNKK